MKTEQIERIFTYRRPFGDQPERYEQLRGVAKVLALVIEQSCPESREKSTAITNLQQALMWANASISINETEPQIV